MSGKGRYSGAHMTIYVSTLPGAASVARAAFRGDKVSERAKEKVKILDWYITREKNQSLTARHFGVQRETSREWWRRLQAGGPAALNDQSHRPHQVRRPETSPAAMIAVVNLRFKYPAWSKYKLHSLLPEGIKISVSTVGRILKRRGLIDKKVSRKRSRSAKHPRARYPRGMRISCSGDMIQMDTKYITLTGGRKYYQFTAIDVLSKRRVLRVYKTQSSANGALFLEECLRAFPFWLKTVQTDNGAHFQKHFDAWCKEKHIPHYYIYPRTPKQNTYVEISHGADEREFYLQGNVYEDFEVMRKKLAEWEYIWNNVRPHQALNYLTPNQYLEKRQTSRLPTRDVITLQA